MNPKLSIITVVYNGEMLLEGTIQSVLQQSYNNIEYVVIDGASKDGTGKILEQYKNQIDILVSEPDRGLYDAMNKGLRLATGDYVWFMNAGDWLYSKDTVQQIFDNQIDADAYYGECMLVNDDRQELGLRSELTPHRLPEQLTWKSMNRGMVVSHQSFIPKRSLTMPYIPNNLCADIDWVIKILKQAQYIQHIPNPLSAYLIGGTSKQRHQESLKNRFFVLQQHFGFLPNLLNHGVIVLRSMYHRWVKRRAKERY